MPKENDLPEALQVYNFHGLDVSATPVGGQVYTDCPWCGREKKFSINARTGQWKCWVCAEGTDNGGGNMATFVRVLWAKSDAATNGASTVLAQERRLLDPMTVTRWGVAQSIITKEWIVPGYNAEGKLCTLYKYVGRPKRLLYPTPTLHHQLFGVPDSFDGKKHTVHFFESLWNAMAFWEVARQARPESNTLTPTANEAKSLLADASVLAGAGCGSIGEPFAKFTPLFSGKDVVLWFDSDHPRQRPDGTTVEGAGWLATQRAVDILQRASEPPKSIRYLNWGDRGHDPSQKSGHDVRDVLSTGPNVSARVALLGGLLGKVVAVPREWTSRETHIRQASKATDKKRAIESLPCSSWRDVLVALRRFFRSRQSVEDTLACMMAVAASTSRVGDQLFLQVLGAAGSGKTQLCDGMLVSKYCYALEGLTGFHSGFRGTGSDSGKDHSILGSHNHQTWITPEADVMVSSPDYAKLMGQARRIFDGKSSKKYGNQIEAMDYQGLRTPWIQAGTPAMLDHGQASVGDRFLKVFIDSPGSDDRADIMRRVGHTALRASLTESNGVPESRHEEHTLAFYRTAGGYVDFLRENVGQALQDLDLSGADDVVDQCAAMAELTAFLRARPYEDKNRKETHNTVELPTRLQAQLVRMAACLSVVLNKGTIDAEVLRMVKKVAINTANGTTLEMVRAIYNMDGDGLEADEIAALVQKPQDLVRRLLSFMLSIGAMEHWTPKGVGKTARRRWRPTAALAEAWGRVHGGEK